MSMFPARVQATEISVIKLKIVNITGLVVNLCIYEIVDLWFIT